MPIEQTKSRLATALVLVYVIAVLTIDTLALGGKRFGVDWSLFRWHLDSGFDLFKFVAWFVVPFACSLPSMDWGYFGLKRWQRIDVLLLLALTILGMLAVLAIPLFPFLRNYYQGLGHRSVQFKWWYTKYQLFWIGSWLVGWEFLHRCFLLKNLQARWPRRGWLLVPVFEGLYHLSKPTWLLEAPGMVVLSLIVTFWAMKRKNVLLPFLAHLIIELELLLFVLLY